MRSLVQASIEVRERKKEEETTPLPLLHTLLRIIVSQFSQFDCWFTPCHMAISPASAFPSSLSSLPFCILLRVPWRLHLQLSHRPVTSSVECIMNHWFHSSRQVAMYFERTPGFFSLSRHRHLHLHHLFYLRLKATQETDTYRRVEWERKKSGWKKPSSQMKELCDYMQMKEALCVCICVPVRRDQLNRPLSHFRVYNELEVNSWRFFHFYGAAHTQTVRERERKFFYFCLSFSVTLSLSLSLSLLTQAVEKQWLCPRIGSWKSGGNWMERRGERRNETRKKVAKKEKEKEVLDDQAARYIEDTLLDSHNRWGREEHFPLSLSFFFSSSVPQSVFTACPLHEQGPVAAAHLLTHDEKDTIFDEWKIYLLEKANGNRKHTRIQVQKEAMRKNLARERERCVSLR